MQNNGIYNRFIKRILDFLLSFISIVLLSPIWIVIAILVKIKLGSPIIFRQDRPGKDESIFHMYKFRSMTDERDKNGKLLPDEMRLTTFGKILRSTSLDELPELFNILKGDMSIVGPRPLLVKYLPLYTEEQRRRHLVKPGITGLAQVNGRNAISWESKFELDCEYVRRVTFIGDLKIVFKTISTVFRREGINSGTSETMEEFTGTPIKGENDE